MFVASQDVRSIVWTFWNMHVFSPFIDVQGLDTSLFGLLHCKVKWKKR